MNFPPLGIKQKTTITKTGANVNDAKMNYLLFILCYELFLKLLFLRKFLSYKMCDLTASYDNTTFFL